MQPVAQTPPLSRVSSVRAVTTIELLVVLLLLMILTGGSILLYFRFYQVSLVSSTAFKIQKAMTTARTHAIQRRAPSQVAIWLDHPSFWIDELDSAGNITAPKIITPEPIHDLVRVLSVDKGGTSVTLGLETIRFQPDGSAEDALVYLILAEADPNDEKEYATIKVYGPTGQVRVFERQKR